MCDPVTLAGIALTVGSTVAKSVAAGQVADARNDALAAERIRQQGLDREADALNLQSQDRYQGFEAKQEERGKNLGDYFASQTVDPGQANIAPASTSSITVQEQGRQNAKAKAFTDKQGAALGDLRSFGDLLGGIGRLQARDASQIGQIGGFKKGSSGVLSHELEAANSAGGGAGTLGDILGLGGSLAIGKGLQGSFVNRVAGSPLSILPATAAPAGSAVKAARDSVFGIF